MPLKRVAGALCRALATVGVFSVAGFAQAAPFTNGSFETNGGQGTQTASPWVFSGNVFVNDQGVNNEGTTDGVFAALFNAGQNPPTGVISQTFDTIALQVYTVTFDWGNFGGNVIQRLQIEVKDGATELINFGSGTVSTVSGATIIQNTNVFQIEDSTGTSAVNAPAPNTEFSLFSFTFTAQSSSSTIIFTDIAPGTANNSDGVLDNVQISVPEPSTWGMMGLGATMLIGAMRFRRRLG